MWLIFWGWFDKTLVLCGEKPHCDMTVAPWATPRTFFSVEETLLWGLHLFSFLLGLFYKKVPVSWGPSGTYYSSLVVINHRRVSISTQRLPRVSNSHSLTVSTTISFLSTCPLLFIAPTWTLQNWCFSCWHTCFLSPVLHRNCRGRCTHCSELQKPGEDLKLTFVRVLHPFSFFAIIQAERS